MINTKEIKEQFDKVIEYSQSIKNPKTDQLFKDWECNKRDIIDAFGNKLIYKYPQKVRFNLDARAKEDRVTVLQEYCMDNQYFDLYHFIRQEKEGFFDNKVVEEYITSDKFVIPKGMKLLKAFKYFIKDNPKKLNDFQMKASAIIQENKIEGYLYLSVHPLDYLSSSENNYNWRSCHSLNGSYRAGNLSYMCDKTTIVCYLCSEEQVVLSHFPPEVRWNNKKWRMLLHMNAEQTLAYAGRQYPFFSEAPLKIINEIMTKLFKGDNNKYWTKWCNHYYTDDYLQDVLMHFQHRYLPLKKPTQLEETITDSKKRLHYNDILYSYRYTLPFYSCAVEKTPYNDKYLAWQPYQVIQVGTDIKCLDCGKNMIEASESTMRCFSCELEHGTECNEQFGVCDWCGTRIYFNDAYYSEYNNKFYCYDCEKKRIRTCNYCDDRLDIDDLKFDENGDYICDFCLNHKTEEELSE